MRRGKEIILAGALVLGGLACEQVVSNECTSDEDCFSDDLDTTVYACDTGQSPHICRRACTRATVRVDCLASQYCDESLEPAVCRTGSRSGEGPYNLVVTGNDFTVYTGELLSAVLVSGGTVVETTAVIVPVNGQFSLSWSEILEKGTDYGLHYFIDHDESGICDPPIAGNTAGDQGWQLDVGTVNAHFTYTVSSSRAIFSPVCESFDYYNLSLGGSGYTDAKYDGVQFHLTLVRNGASSDDLPVVRDSDTGATLTMTGAGELSTAFPGTLQRGLRYRLDMYADLNGDNTCTPADDGWRIDIPEVTGNQVIVRDFDTSFASVCNSF